LKTLRMYFGTQDNGRWLLSVRYPKDNLTAQDVQNAMQAIIDSGAIVSGPVTILSADIVDRNVSELF